MAKTHPPYAPEFRRQMVELVRAGRDPADLAREFEPSSQAIRNWVAQADRQDSARADEALLARIKTVHISSRQTYGAPRVHAELRAAGERHGRKRIARLMRVAG